MSTFRGFARGNIHAPAHRFAVLSSASAYPAAGTISDKGRSQRRSVKNRRPFDCFKSAEGIRFSAVARTTPKSFHRGGFWRNLLTSKGCIEKKKCGSQNRADRGPPPSANSRSSRAELFIYKICVTFATTYETTAARARCNVDRGNNSLYLIENWEAPARESIF